MHGGRGARLRGAGDGVVERGPPLFHALLPEGGKACARTSGGRGDTIEEGWGEAGRFAAGGGAGGGPCAGDAVSVLTRGGRGGNRATCTMLARMFQHVRNLPSV